MFITMNPIGTFRCSANERYEAPRQPLMETGEGIISLNPGCNFEQALEDLEGFDKIWVFFWFDRNKGWRPKVRPPRGEGKRGVFATRSPHRPNPLGMSCVDLKHIEGRNLFVGSNDLLDGTPILDIKPYIPYADAFPDAKCGWIETLEEDNPYSVEWSPTALQQINWIRQNGGPDLEQATSCRLQLSPHPHPGRRITPATDGTWELAYKTWRIYYSLDEQFHRVNITHITSGYTKASLEGEADPWGDKQLHRAFIIRF